MNPPEKSSLKTELQKLNTYYEVGDYWRARRLARQLIADHAPQAGDRERLDQVLAATRIDPVGIGAIVFTIAMLLYLFVVYAV